MIFLCEGIGPCMRTKLRVFWDWQSASTSRFSLYLLERAYEPWSKLLEGGYIGDSIGDYYRAY